MPHNTVAFSGYRPTKFANHTELATLQGNLRTAILDAIAQGFTRFLVGMAEGFDTFAGQAVLSLKNEGHAISLICVLPVKDQSYKADSELLQRADNIIHITESYHTGAYHLRNRYLVDHSSLLICYYDGQDGGTSYTVEYAIKQEKRVHNLYTESVLPYAPKPSLTPFHAKFFALELLQKKSSNSDERLTSALGNSSLEINPHQVEAALFAFKSPFSKGVLLADEVGLGKTIEAGLVLCQLHAEHKKRLLVICPASLRKQWALELEEKFHLPSFILEAKTYTTFHEQIQHHISMPTAGEAPIIITSYNYASKMADALQLIAWDLVVIDEAHKLRNAYRASNKTGQNIKRALGESKKLLLTATPLQNTLTELYGLSSIIDEHIFGDIKSFQDQYVTNENFFDLKERLSHFCKRTLRKDIKEYIKYTKRVGILQSFNASNAEVKLYTALSDFLQKGSIYAVPERQKTLTTLIIRKVLASSTWAVLQTLETIYQRLIKIRDGVLDHRSQYDSVFDEDALEAYYENQDEPDGQNNQDAIAESLTLPTVPLDLVQLQSEIDTIASFIGLAKTISTDTKSQSLLDALSVGFAETNRLGGNKKALIFTESRRTQDYLKLFLEEHGYQGKIVLFNGQNSGKEASDIYKNWFAENASIGRTSGSKTADMRMALVEHFRDSAEICIATEAAAEGVNLQFCSLVINYDLPWNPQRIEQRIGRCHRYGQKSDVVVINFVNRKNYADVRVVELLEQKLKLFDGIFGSSDEVLGTIESGVDFEKRIFSIYQECRSQEEIQSEFDSLQKEMDAKIKKTMKKTREMLFENFDADVHERLKLHISGYLDRYSRLFWELSKYIIGDKAVFFDTYKTFMLKSAMGKSPLGKYCLLSHAGAKPKGYAYRTGHSLGKTVLSAAQNLDVPHGKIRFAISQHQGYKLSVVENLQGKRGYLSLSKLTITNMEQEEHLLFCGFLEDGTQLAPETCQKLFDCMGTSTEHAMPPAWQARLTAEAEQYAKGTLAKVEERNMTFMQDEEERIRKWEQDMIIALEKELVNIKKRIMETDRMARKATSTTEKLALQSKLQDLNKRKRNARAKLEENEEEIYERRDALIRVMQKNMRTRTDLAPVFTIAWEVV